MTLTFSAVGVGALVGGVFNQNYGAVVLFRATAALVGFSLLVFGIAQFILYRYDKAQAAAKEQAGHGELSPAESEMSDYGKLHTEDS